VSFNFGRLKWLL